MARKIQSRLQIKGTLMTETPLHVGGYGESFETDMALAKNGKDQFYIPGTSLTGTLRAWFEKAFGKDETIEIWGFQEDEMNRVGTKDDRSKASFVLIEDMTLPEQVQSELRDGVGINRVYGTAANQAKFDRAILPKGTELNFEMTVEVQKDAPKIKARFGHLLEALEGGSIRLGASKTRGLGKVKLQNTKIKEDAVIGLGILNLLETKAEQEKRFTPFDVFKEQLQQVTTGETNSAYEKFKPQSQSRLEIKVVWRPKSALMVKASYDGIGVDMLPLTSGNGRNRVSLCLPGSSIKGAFRSHAERIMRTLTEMKDEKTKHEELSKEEFHEQINKIELINELFGAKKEKNGQASHLGLGALSIDDCYAEKAIEEKSWREVESGKMKNDESYSSQELWQALKRIDLNKKPDQHLSESEKFSDTRSFKISHHVAIDRWTGGASEGALYSVLQPASAIRWNDICLTLDLSRFKPDDKKLQLLMLLLLVLRDFAENRLSLGFAANRGMGEVVVEKIEGLEKIPKFIEMEEESFTAEMENGRLVFKGDEVKKRLKGVWSYE